MLIDGSRPEVRNIYATKNDGKYLPNDSIIVEFNEPINKATAEDPANYTINGKNLKDQVKDQGITLLDVEESYDETGKKIFNWEAIKEINTDKDGNKLGKERNLVIIELKPSFARNEIRNAQNNLLQVKSVADWAGLIDLTDNNKISTQEKGFFYDVPEIEAGLNLQSQSPEQFVLQLGDDLYTDVNTENKFNFANAENNIKVTLEEKNRDGSNFKYTLTTEDYEIRAVETGIEDNKYVLELKKTGQKY